MTFCWTSLSEWSFATIARTFRRRHAVVAVDDRRQVHLARRDPGLGDVRDPQLVRVRGAGSGESGVWHKTVICWLVLVAYLYIQCENYAFAALPLLVFAASKVRRER